MSLKTIREGRVFQAVLLTALLMTSAGCRQDGTAIRVEEKAMDATITVNSPLPAEGPTMSVVTGEPAKIPVKGRAADGATAEDKAGAVAFKLQY